MHIHKNLESHKMAINYGSQRDCVLESIKDCMEAMGR